MNKCFNLSLLLILSINAFSLVGMNDMKDRELPRALDSLVQQPNVDITLLNNDIKNLQSSLSSVQSTVQALTQKCELLEAQVKEHSVQNGKRDEALKIKKLSMISDVLITGGFFAFLTVLWKGVERYQSVLLRSLDKI